MRKVLIFAALMAAPAPLAAADWRVVSVDEDSGMGAAIAFVDIDSVTRAGDGNVAFTMEVRFSRPPEPNWDGLRATMRADCAGHRWESTGSMLLAGNEIVTRSGPTPMEQATRDTNAWTVIDGVCAGRYQSDSVEPVAHARGAFGGR